MDVEKVFEEYCTFAKKEFLRDGNLCPIFFGHRKDGQNLILPFRQAGETFEEQKELQKKTFDIFKFVFFCHQIDYYIFIVETWFLDTTSENMEKMKGSLENVKERKEGILIAFVSHTKKFSRVYEIIRTANSTELVFRLEEPNFSGAFSELLPPKGKKPTEADMLVFKCMMQESKK